jgi:hypothetical protein
MLPTVLYEFETWLLTPVHKLRWDTLMSIHSVMLKVKDHLESLLWKA